MLKAITARLLRDVAGDDSLPLTLQSGDRVNVEQAHPTRPGYHWCTDGGLCSGWVPDAMLYMNSGTGTARDMFCSQLLAAKAGDSVRVMWRGQGFEDTWCEDAAGDRGWVPNDALEVDQPAAEE